MDRTAMNPLQQWIKLIGELLVAGAAAESSDLTELRIRKTAFLTSNRMLLICEVVTASRFEVKKA
jgi:hypothetical protein